MLGRDLSSPYRYLLIAEELLAAGRADAAIKWAERGLAVFDERADPRLVDFVCERYANSGRHDQATQLAWETLEQSRRVDAYQRLAKVTSHAGTWESWREPARDLLRSGRRSASRAGDRSELVAALLWEQDHEQAWREAKEGGCRRDLWLALARVRERDHPGDALEVYLAQIEPAIRASDNHTYAGAVEWLEKAQALYARLGRGHAFDELVLGLRERHRAKRNLTKRLDERSWPQPSSKRAVHS